MNIMDSKDFKSNVCNENHKWYLVMITVNITKIIHANANSRERHTYSVIKYR